MSEPVMETVAYCTFHRSIGCRGGDGEPSLYHCTEAHRQICDGEPDKEPCSMASRVLIDVRSLESLVTAFGLDQRVPS